MSQACTGSCTHIPKENLCHKCAQVVVRTHAKKSYVTDMQRAFDIMLQMIGKVESIAN